jgi:hypothetical protein
MFQYSERPCGCIQASNVADRAGSTHVANRTGPTDPTTFIAQPCLQHLHVEERRQETMAIAEFIALLVCIFIALIVLFTIPRFLQS